MNSEFYNILQEYHGVPFDWKTNNCGLFVAKIYTRLYNKDFVSMFTADYDDEKSAFEYLNSKGGYDAILLSLGFEKRQDGKIFAGDIVVCENAIGIYDGGIGLFAGSAYRRRAKLESAYYYNNTEK